MAATKRERLDEFKRRLCRAAPFRDGAIARMTIEEVMRAVEDELSGIPENPQAAIAPPDGRMYPPDDRFEISSGSPLVRAFKQTRHRTYIGANGSILIINSDSATELDLRGDDGRTIADLMQEQQHEPD